MPPFVEMTIVIVLLRENTNSKLTLREKISVQYPVSSCSVRTSVETFISANFPEWVILEYATTTQ